MKKLPLLLLSIVLFTFLCCCTDSAKYVSVTPTTKYATESEAATTEKLTAASDPSRLICAVWKIVSQTHNGSTKDVADGEVLCFYQNGYIQNEYGEDIGVWMLQEDLLTTYTGAGIQNYKVTEITNSTLSLQQTGGSDFAMTLSCIEQTDYIEGAYVFSEEMLIGTWSETGNMQKENALRILEDGSMEFFYNGELSQIRYWSLLQGNRVSLTMGNERQIMAITQVDENCLELLGIRFYRIG